MGVRKNVSIGEIHVYKDPKNPTTSEYDVVLPVTSTEAVFDSISNKNLSALLGEKMPVDDFYTHPNLLTNGNMSISQRGTTFFDNSIYTLDCWHVDSYEAGLMKVSQLKYQGINFLRLEKIKKAITSKITNIMQINPIHCYSGDKFVMSCRALIPINSSINLTFYNGTGYDGQKFKGTGFWQIYSRVINITNYSDVFQFIMQIETEKLGIGDSVDITDAKLERGEIYTPNVPKSSEQEKLDSLNRYERSGRVLESISEQSITVKLLCYRFKGQKRIVPNVKFYPANYGFGNEQNEGSVYFYNGEWNLISGTSVSIGIDENFVFLSVIIQGYTVIPSSFIQAYFVIDSEF